ncbi:MAG TPA: CopG family antitoxin [Chloroflexota bacterium]|nr:CopG family antitoxin [Chloroflexota bacterium]
MREGTEPLHVINDLADIPAFHDEAEEAAFWRVHRLSDALLAQMQPLGDDVAPRARATKSVTLRIDPGLLARIQALAQQRRVPYQRLLKQLLEERLQEVEVGDQPGAPAATSAAAVDPEAVRQTARSIARLARELETAVASLT